MGINIKGYRELTDSEKMAINHLKTKEEDLLAILESITTDENARHTALARTHIETGFMFAIKAIAKPAPYYEQ